MTRGGRRPGAGRPKGSANRPKPNAPKLKGEYSPLDYMLAVMRDDSADPQRRDDMAKAAARYVHGTGAAKAPGKKAAAEEAAQQVGGDGSEWGDDLRTSAALPN